MARNKVDACMFCMEAPCVCNAPAKVEKPKAPRKPRKPAAPIVAAEPETGGSSAEPPAQKADSVSVKDRMKAASKNRKRPPIALNQEQQTIADIKATDEITDDPGFASAIRALEPLLGREDRIKYKRFLSTEPTPAERAVTWKNRRADV